MNPSPPAWEVGVLFDLLVAPAVLIPILFWPGRGIVPDEVHCPFCGVLQPITGIFGHMMIRGRCRGRKLSMVFRSLERRRW